MVCKESWITDHDNKHVNILGSVISRYSVAWYIINFFLCVCEILRHWCSCLFTRYNDKNVKLIV